MTQTPIIPPKTRKPIAWWKAGLLGMVVNLCSILVYLGIDDLTEGISISSWYMDDYVLAVVLTLPTLIFNAIYTNLNKNSAKNLIQTVKVAWLSITVPVVYAYYIIYIFKVLLSAIFADEIFRWGIKETFDTIAFFSIIYGCTAVIAAALIMFSAESSW